MTGGRRTAVVLLVAAMATVAVAGVTPAAGATGDQFVSMTSTTTPSQPTTEGEFTFTARFHSADASGGAATVESIEVHDASDGDGEVLASRSFSGSEAPELTPGGNLAESFSLEFDEPGTKELSVELTFESDARLVTTRFRTNVTVYRPGPGIQVAAEPTTAGERTTLTVDVANGLAETIRDVELSLAVDGADVDDASRVSSSVTGGAAETFAFEVTPETLGSHDVRATLSYTTADGTRRTATRDVDVRFRSPSFEGDVGVAAEVAPAIPGAETTLNLTLTNGLDRGIRQLEVTVDAGEATVKQHRRVATGFATGSQRTFRFAVSRATTGSETVEVVVSFTTEDGVDGQVTETLTTSFDAPANPGEIQLTSASATRTGDELEVSATASNVGGSDVAAVVVSVGDDASVASADYFVGNVEGGDFASFTLSTAVEGNLSTVPVTVSYVVDDVRRETTTEVRVEQTVIGQPSGGGGGGALPIIAGAVALVVVVGAALVYRRRG